MAWLTTGDSQATHFLAAHFNRTRRNRVSLLGRRTWIGSVVGGTFMWVGGDACDTMQLRRHSSVGSDHLPSKYKYFLLYS
jgi:hypothetical protein